MAASGPTSSPASSARPKEIVLDRAFCTDLLSRGRQDIFVRSQAIVIAETRPRDIHIWKGYVQISEHALPPYAMDDDAGRAVSTPKA